MPMVNLKPDVYRKLRRLKRGKSFSATVDELIAERATAEGDEILAGLRKWSGRKILKDSVRASARHQRAD